MAIALLAALTMGAAPSVEPIGMTIHSWGKKVSEWRIDPDGTITATTMDKGNPAYSPPYTFNTRQTVPAPDRYREIASLLRSARSRAGQTLPCKNPSTDAPSGEVSWGQEKLGYYAGCYEAGTRRVIGQLFDANKRIEAWTKDAPIVATREEK